MVIRRHRHVQFRVKQYLIDLAFPLVLFSEIKRDICVFAHPLSLHYHLDYT